MLENKAELIRILKDFHILTGYRISIFDCALCEQIAYPAQSCAFCRCLQTDPLMRQKCYENDASAFCQAGRSGTQSYRCHAGLREIVSPLYSGGALMGYLMLGQMVETPQERAAVLDAVSDFSGDRRELTAAARALPLGDRARLDACISLLELLTGYLSLNGRFLHRSADPAEMAASHIRRYYGQKITLDSLSACIGCSRATLSRVFRDRYCVSVGEYLAAVRIDQAKRKLTDSPLSIKEIAALCGYADQNYFSRAFSKAVGCPPRIYREKRESID